MDRPRAGWPHTPEILSRWAYAHSVLLLDRGSMSSLAKLALS